MLRSDNRERNLLFQSVFFTLSLQKTSLVVEQDHVPLSDSHEYDCHSH
jgi:hypothetical protein